MHEYNSTDLETRKTIAADCNSPPEILEELSLDENRDIRFLVASNPNTDAEVLFQLSEEFPEAVTGNPIFDILVLENPGSYSLRMCLARSPSTPEETLARLADTVKADDIKILGAIALNASTPIPILEKLTSWYPKDKNSDSLYHQSFVGEAVAKNPKTPLSLLEKLALHESCYVREAVAQNLNISVAILEELAEDETFDVLLAVIEHPKTPISVVTKLANSTNSNARLVVAQHTHTPVSILEKLAGDEAPEVLQAIVEHPKTPISVIEKLATNESTYVREAVAKHTQISVSTLDKLAKNEGLYVWTAIAEHPKTSRSILKKLAHNIGDEIRDIAVKKPDTLASILKEAGDETSKLLQAILEDSKTSKPALKWLEGKNDREIRQTVLAALNIINQMVYDPIPF